MHDIFSYLQTLASEAHPQGGWGYGVGQPAQPEPTCLALLALALAADRFQEAINEGEAALQRCASEDGAYRRQGDREEVTWRTALALFAFLVFEPNRHPRAARCSSGPHGNVRCRISKPLPPAYYPWPRASPTISKRRRSTISI